MGRRAACSIFSLGEGIQRSAGGGVSRAQVAALLGSEGIVEVSGRQASVAFRHVGWVNTDSPQTRRNLWLPVKLPPPSTSQQR